MKSATTKYHGITHMYTGETYIKDIIATLSTDKYLKDELAAETYMALNEMPEDKFLYLFNHGQIRWYCCGMIRNQIRSTTSKFYRSHLRPQKVEDEFDASIHIKSLYEHSTDKEEMVAIIDEAVDTLDFYRKELFKLYYYANMSYGQISDYTAKKNTLLRIPKNSIWSAVKSAREEVVIYLKKNYADAFDEEILNEIERNNI